MLTKRPYIRVRMALVARRDQAIPSPAASQPGCEIFLLKPCPPECVSEGQVPAAGYSAGFPGIFPAICVKTALFAPGLILF